MPNRLWYSGLTFGIKKVSREVQRWTKDKQINKSRLQETNLAD